MEQFQEIIPTIDGLYIHTTLCIGSSSGQLEDVDPEFTQLGAKLEPNRCSCQPP